MMLLFMIFIFIIFHSPYQIQIQQNKKFIIMSLTLGGYGNSQPAESKKIFCAYHRTQFLTNFCIQKQCLMPLCPSCVAEHTQQHYQSSQKPTYVNLNEALHQVKQKCYANIISLQQCNRKNDQLIRYRENLEQNIHEQLTECKQQIYGKIQKIFQIYQSKLIKQVQQKYAQLSVYEQQENQTIKQYITEQIQILYDKIGMLKSDQCLAALIRFYDHEMDEYQQGLKDVHDYLTKHKKVGVVHIKLNVQAANQKLQNMCEDLLFLNHIKEQEKGREDGKQNIRSSKIRRNTSNNAINMTPNNKETTRPLAEKNNDRNKLTPINNFQQKSKRYPIY